MRISLLAAAFGLVLFCNGASAVERDVSRVFLPPAEPADPRLHVTHDVDHPWAFDPHYTDKSQWQQRARALREQILVAEGLWPEPERTPLNAVIHGKIERDGYTIEKVFFASMPGHYVSGSLYRPTGKTGRLPAVLSPHGHWPGGRFYEVDAASAKKQIDMGAEQTLNSARYPLQARCAMLARMGCVVFHYDMIGYADSQAITHREGFNDIDATLRLQSFMGLQTWNSIRSLDFLCSLPDVDPNRVAVTGASGGGTQTLILCAIDDRPAVSFPAVMVSESMQGGCICENSPLLRLGTNNAEIAACFAPRPLGMSSANDWTRELLTRGYPQIRSVYALFGAADDVAAWHRSFPHNYNQVSRELMYNWFNKYLKLGLTAPVKEAPFDPVPPRELSVYDAEHPRPADSLDAAALRQRMSAASDAQLSALAKNPAEFQRVVRTALGVLVSDHLPASSDVLEGDDRGPKAEDGFALLKGTIRRTDRPSQVPYVALVPNGWKGKAVVWVHPLGKASLLDPAGKPTDDVRTLLDRKVAVIAPDVLFTGELLGPTGKMPALQSHYETLSYAGYHFGYNPAVIASRTSDVLSAIAFVKGWEGTRSVNVVAFGKLGPAALLARGLSGSAVQSAAIDLDHLDFAAVHDDADEMMLPGAMKYGGMSGFIALCADGHTALWNAPNQGNIESVKRIQSAQMRPDEARPHVMIEWLEKDD